MASRNVVRIEERYCEIAAQDTYFCLVPARNVDTLPRCVYRCVYKQNRNSEDGQHDNAPMRRANPEKQHAHLVALAIVLGAITVLQGYGAPSAPGPNVAQITGQD